MRLALCRVPYDYSAAMTEGAGPQMPRVSWRLAGLLLASVLLASCGGSETPDSAPDAKTSSPAELDPTPSPSATAPELKADKKTEKLAIAAILRTKDFGSAWKEYSEASTPTTEQWMKGCVNTAGGLPDRIGVGALQTGPTMELKKGTAFVTSYSFVLPSEKAAKKLTSSVAGPSWVGCKKKDLIEFLKGQELTDLKVVVDPQKNPNLGGAGGLESETVYLYKDKKGRVTSTNTHSFYRIGRVVILVNAELGYNEDAQFDAFQNEVYEALSKAYDRVNAAL